eukprot:TRINITY_DN1479_c0_g1_i3.p1 TRINITY_DN1479_c0_g1~~TRINITY_DN1479_c0_g1_i3.p1  ORF type:complete len:749 (-),score=114.23 TRINITY_DN1479_c0_g1_i3:96-2282(-)
MAEADDYDVMKGRIIATWIPSSPAERQNLYKQASLYLSTLRSDGTWPDIDYHDQNRVYWNTAQHLNPRALSLVLAYTTPGQPLYNSSSLLSSISNVIDVWVKNDFQNPNWWYNDIFVPTAVGELSVLFYEHETLAQRAGFQTVLQRANYTAWTGANLVWMATVHIYHGLSYNEHDDVLAALQRIYKEIAITYATADGIKVDGTFYQHGQQLYDGGYGADLTNVMLNITSWTSGTSLSMPSSSLSAFGVLVLDGQQWMAQRGHPLRWDNSALGRSITRPEDNFGMENATVVFPPEKLRMISGPRAAEYKVYADRIEYGGSGGLSLFGNRHFWKGDYMVHHRPGYVTSVRMHSTRTYNSECVNDEGKKSLHLGDGCNYLYNSGLEYREIFPVWDWTRIPGTTAATQGGPLLQCTTVKTLGTTSFVGGVSDGVYGVAAYDFASPLDGKLRALKSWHFYDDCYIAITSGIQSNYTNDAPISTIIQQSWLDGPVYTYTNPLTPLKDGVHILAPHAFATGWVWHADTGYIIEAQSLLGINVTIATQSGNWADIGVTNMNASGKVFTLSLPHGTNFDKTNEFDAYVVVPNITYTGFLNYFKNWNSEGYQEVFPLLTPDAHATMMHFNKNNNTAAGQYAVGAVFRNVTHNQGLVPNIPVEFSVSQPCAVLAIFSPHQITISVSNPSQLPIHNDVTVTFFKQSFLPNQDCSADGHVTFALNEGEYAGQTKTVICNLP